MIKKIISQNEALGTPEYRSRTFSQVVDTQIQVVNGSIMTMQVS